MGKSNLILIEMDSSNDKSTKIHCAQYFFAFIYAVGFMKKKNPKHECVCKLRRDSGKDTFATDPENPSRFLICLSGDRIYVTDCPQVRSKWKCLYERYYLSDYKELKTLRKFF